MDVDAHLDQVALHHMAWKNKKLLTACLLIAAKAVEKVTFWPDEVVFDHLLTDDRNCIGSAWRLMAKLGMVEKTRQFRRSTFGPAAGRVIFEYRCVNHGLAKAFLRRYDLEKYRALSHPQLSLGL